MKEGEKKMELMSTTLQTLIKNTLKEKGEKTRNEERERYRKGSTM